MPKNSPSDPCSCDDSSTSLTSQATTCPLEEKKLIQAEWNPEEAWCSQNVCLFGTACNFDPNTEGTAKLISTSHGEVESLSCKGQNSFAFSWQLKNVPFEGASMPEKDEIKGSVTADGQTVETEKLLTVKRVPDKAPEPVSFRRSSGIYGWDASFKIGIDKDNLNVKQILQIKKA